MIERDFLTAPQIIKDLARPQHRTIMLFITNSLMGNVPNV